MNAVIDGMIALALRYLTEMNRRPYGYVMGIKDWRAVRAELGQLRMIADGVDRPAGAIAVVNGLPVFLKSTSGIELLIDEDAAQRILYMSQEERVKALKAGILT